MERHAEYQLTRDEAVQFGEERRWEQMTPMGRGLFQLRQRLLCMPFDKFHEGVTELLGRDIYTHEFACVDSLWEEYEGRIPAPDLAAIIAKLPTGTQVIVVAQDLPA